ncbi:MAG: hypothetical protein AB7O62_07465 [Pirellulales bacterium]
MGTLLDGPANIAKDSFAPNQQFSHFLAWVIAKHANSSAELLAEAQRQHKGYVYILDMRTDTPDGPVPPEDIIGGFEVANGKLLRFHSSPNHQLLSDRGFMQLDQYFNACLVNELVVRSQRTAGQDAQ